MSHFKFEGDKEDFSASQVAFISSVLEKRGFTNEKVLVQPVGKADDNYVANVKRLTVQNEDGSSKFKMVVKVAPTSQQFRQNMMTALMFANESIMYKEFLPKISRLEVKAGLSEEERMRHAECYDTFMEEPHELILLEDLCESGFVMLDKSKSLSNDTIKVVLKNFAKLHSLSYALKTKEPETYEVFKKKLYNTWELFQSNPELQFFVKQMEDDLMALVDEDIVKYVKGSVVNLGTNMVKNLKIDRDSKYSVIQQGDSWTNNIMFTVEEGVTKGCCMIDYQISNCNSPVADLHYMILNCTDYETRKQHYHEWLDYYHDELDKCLHNHGLKANFVYPRDQFDADMKRYSKCALGVAVMLAGTLAKDTKEAQSFKDSLHDSDMQAMIDKNKLTQMQSSTIQWFKDRVSGVVHTFLDLGYLTQI